MKEQMNIVYEGGQGEIVEKKSRFICSVLAVNTEEEAIEFIEKKRKQYWDATHNCFAYVVGERQQIQRCSDDGEPSGTAGKPILGQINSFELTNVVIVVVRYFGGIKLGTSGLIVAYREAAAEAIRAGEIIECHEQGTVSFSFPYLGMNDVMKLVKTENLTILSQEFDNLCTMTVQTRADNVEPLTRRIADIDGTSIIG